ncbi:MAG: YDG domain-containing protein [Gemmataceae bacterium]
MTGSITANDKVADGTTTATIASRTLTGVKPGDVVQYVGGTATFSQSSPGTNLPVTATGLSLSGTDAANYTVNTTATTTADITENDTSGPTVTISAPSLLLTSSGPVTYTVTYSDPNFAASTLSLADIHLNKTGSATGTVSVDAATRAVRIITISNISGARTLSITLAAGTARATATLEVSRSSITRFPASRQHSGAAKPWCSSPRATSRRCSTWTR